MFRLLTLEHNSSEYIYSEEINCTRDSKIKASEWQVWKIDSTSGYKRPDRVVTCKLPKEQRLLLLQSYFPGDLYYGGDIKLSDGLEMTAIWETSNSRYSSTLVWTG